jgi:hypothetical protein
MKWYWMLAIVILIALLFNELSGKNDCNNWIEGSPGKLGFCADPS